MDVSKEFKDLIGFKIHFRTYDGEFEATVKSVSLEMKQVTMENVYDCLQNVCIGNLTFFFYEFLTYSTINKYRNPQIGENNLSLDSKTNFSKNNCRTKVSFKETTAKLQPEKLVAENDQNCSEFVLKLPPNLQHELTNDFVILDSIDLEFKSATSHISRQSVIGVSFHGSEISRIGKLFWICIATKYCVFLYDIQALGTSAFDLGLRNIFQSENIVKIIHDCRRPSDCLYYVFSTKLCNVFDVQVADFVIRQKSEGKSVYVNIVSLDKCLVKYLAVPKEFLYVLPSVEGNYFSKRPLDKECLNILIKDTLYLIILREKLTKLMLNSVYKASELYLKVIAESPKLTSASSVPSVIPPALLQQGLEIITLQKGSLKSSATTITSELKQSFRKAGPGAKEVPERGICKTVAPNLEYCLDNNTSNSRRESKHFLNTLMPATPETLANGIVQKRSVICKEIVCDKSHKNEKFEKSPSQKSCSEILKHKSLESSNDLISKTGVTKAQHIKNYMTNKCCMNAIGAETKSYSKLGSQNESSDKDENSFNITNRSIPDYSDTWKKLRSAYGDASDNLKSVRKSNIKIIPSGMNC